MDWIAIAAANFIAQETERQTLKKCLGDIMLILADLYNMHEKKK